MTSLMFTEEQLREYTKRTGLGEHGKANQKPADVDQKPAKRSKYGNRRTECGGGCLIPHTRQRFTGSWN